MCWILNFAGDFIDAEEHCLVNGCLCFITANSYNDTKIKKGFPGSFIGKHPRMKKRASDGALFFRLPLTLFLGIGFWAKGAGGHRGGGNVTDFRLTKSCSLAMIILTSVILLVEQI